MSGVNEAENVTVNSIVIGERRKDKEWKIYTEKMEEEEI